MCVVVGSEPCTEDSGSARSCGLGSTDGTGWLQGAMASPPDPVDRVAAQRRHVQQAYLSPLDTVRDFFEVLGELRSLASNPADSKRLLETCEQVSVCGEQVVSCLNQQMCQYHQASEAAQQVSGAFRLGLCRLMQLKRECNDLKHYIKELQLAEHGLDARKVEPLSSNLQQKQQNQRDFVVPGGNSSIPRSASYEDFRKHRDHQLSIKKSSGSKKSLDGSSGSGIRKAKSESDIAMQSLKKKVESLGIDNTRLRKSEKKLLKETITLSRQCKMMEDERDRAEDRLKIEQTQRDSIEKLRQRNKELEEQLRKLCETQVLREREAETQQHPSDQTASEVPSKPL